ncbi:MAG TPA: response regulator [Ramlibacter sp.]|uniref:response regulator n=1 Tax=Ramlibacter sp. TaxID=1917967 RepID=UPI002B6D6948|nr:response regulator [Ramlibacter sp.]HVZ45057.1 response regulator [Ramlibacter sp.]
MNTPRNDASRAPRDDILLVEDNPDDARLIRALLAEQLGRDRFDLRVGESVGEALRLIAERAPDVVLLDLSVCDSFGLGTLYKIQNSFHALPVIVLTGNRDEQLGLKAVKSGAQDFLDKHELSGRLLVKSMQYARERKLNETSLRTSEARFRSLAELSSDWYWEQDADRRFTFLSEGLADKCGVDPATLIGRRWWEVRWCAAGDNDWKLLHEAMDAREAFHDLVIRCGGSPSLYISISGMPVMEHGVFMGYRGLGKDVSARESAAAALRASEERFRRAMETGSDDVLLLDAEGRERVRELATQAAMKSDAERANAAKSRFMAAVSHDLRQPMHALTLFLENLKGTELPETSRQLVTRMESALHSTQLLLDSILVMSRLENGMIVPNFTSFDLQPVLDRIRLGFEGAAKRKGLRLHVRPSRAVVFSDIGLLERILSNLVANALRYTDRGGVLVACRERGDTLQLEVWDTGVGIAAQHQAAIFDEFFRIDRGNDHQGGIGLGLTIVRSCSALLDCTVRLRSEPGRGSRFWLRVPLRTQPAVAMPPLVPQMHDEDGARPFPGLGVLLVDNDHDILQATCSVLQRWGCVVAKATSGQQAEALLEASGSAPDLVISDLRLDDGELGTDLVMRLRKQYGQKLPALLLSGDTSLQTAREVRRHGLKLLYKPLPPGRLRAAIEGLLA